MVYGTYFEGLDANENGTVVASELEIEPANGTFWIGGLTTINSIPLSTNTISPYSENVDGFLAQFTSRNNLGNHS